MEVWILLAAAGSGYLARRWQNAQRPKGSSADEAEDDNGAGPSHYMPTHRGRYRHFSSSERRQVGKSICGKGGPYWVRSKNVGNASECKMRNKAMIGEGGSEASREDHLCDADSSTCEICADVRDLNEDEFENLPAEEALSDRLAGMQVSSSLEGKAQCLVEGRHGLEEGTQEVEDVEGKVSVNYSYSALSRSVSGKRTNDSLDGKFQRGGQMHQDGYAGKRMKDTMDNTGAANHGENCVFESWMPGFWDVSEGVFVLDTENLLVQRNKGSSSSRKSRTPNKYSKGKGIRKKNLTGLKPMSSLESCLSAQLDEDYNRRSTQTRELFSDVGPKNPSIQSLTHEGSFMNEGKMGVSRTEFAIGLPSLSRHPSSKKFPSKSRTPRSSIGKAVSEDACNPFAKGLQSEGKPTFERFNCRKGRAGSSLAGLLFNFGVGVGMMFTVMSNMREVRRLTLLLKEAESLIEDLEVELERKDDVESADINALKNKGKGAAYGLEQRQSFVTNTLRKVRSATESLCSMKMLLTNEPGSSLQHARSKDMSKLEAELEAELERMALNLGDADVLKLQSKSTGSSVLDGEVGDLVRGELTILGLPHEGEKEWEDGDGSSSSHEDLRAKNYAISPRALAKRLHEVLEAQQEQRISDLEAELKLLSSKLEAREEEVKWLKNSSRGVFSGDAESLSFVEKKEQQSPQHRPHQKRSTGSEGFSKAKEQAPRPQVSLSPNASPVSPCVTSKNLSVFKKGIKDKSTAFITLGGEALAAYKEACDEFSKVSNDPVGPFSPMSKKPERQGEEPSAQDCKVDAKHVGSADGWEQVDLLSLAEDFYVGGDPDLLENMPPERGTLPRERRCPRRKLRKGHPEPEQPYSSSRGVDSSDDATNDTSVSTPCSVKFMDVRMVGYCQSEGVEGDKGERDVSSSAHTPLYGDWSPEIFIRAGVNTPTQEECHNIHPNSDNSSCQFLPSLKKGDWCLPDDSDYYSELDEQLGQLLIKRIVEKTRKGSPIVQDAQTVLEYLEKNEPMHAAD